MNAKNFQDRTTAAVIHTAFEKSPRMVAFVDVTDMGVGEALDYCYRVTQNINGSWSKGPTIKWEGKEMPNEDYNEDILVMAELPVSERTGEKMGLRSTSVGDHILVGNKKYCVEYSGFSSVC